MTPARYLRDMDARDSALAAMLKAHERLAETEQIFLLEGREEDAQTAHELAVRVLRAYSVEETDPDPVEGPWCDCRDCTRYRLRSPE
jgi:hypothetical protein